VGAGKVCPAPLLQVMSQEPKVTGRPMMPAGYGVTDDGDYLDWATVRAGLESSLHYWMATTRPDGRPHVVPRWGVWLDDRFWYDGSPETRHSRNLAKNPAATLHLESGEAATIADGYSRPSEPLDPPTGERVSAAFRAKYQALGYAPEPDAWSGPDAGGMHVFMPTTVLAWTEFPGDLTRFSFDL